MEGNKKNFFKEYEPIPRVLFLLQQHPFIGFGEEKDPRENHQHHEENEGKLDQVIWLQLHAF